MTRADVEAYLGAALEALADAARALSEARREAVPHAPPTPCPVWHLALGARIAARATDLLLLRAGPAEDHVGWSHGPAHLAAHLHYQPRAVVRAERRIRAAAQWHLDRIAGLQRHCAHEQALHADECREIEAAAVAATLEKTP